MIDDVDVEVVETTAAGPDEAVETLNLPQQFARLAGPFLRERRPDRSGHPVGAHGDDVADFAVLDALVQLLQARRL